MIDLTQGVVRSDLDDDPPVSDVIDAALTHLVESKENLETVWDKYPPQEVKGYCNTSMLRLTYRREVGSAWR